MWEVGKGEYLSGFCDAGAFKSGFPVCLLFNGDRCSARVL